MQKSSLKSQKRENPNQTCEPDWDMKFFCSYNWPPQLSFVGFFPYFGLIFYIGGLLKSHGITIYQFGLKKTPYVKRIDFFAFCVYKNVSQKNLLEYKGK